jgi:hypothetical protein
LTQATPAPRFEQTAAVHVQVRRAKLDGMTSLVDREHFIVAPLVPLHELWRVLGVVVPGIAAQVGPVEGRGSMMEP